MRLLTVNLWNDRTHPAEVARLLDDLAPEVLVAQEVGPEAARVIRGRFRHGEVEGRLDTNGRAMVSLVPLQVEDLPLPGRPGYRGRLVLDGEPVELLGVHLANPVDGPAKLVERRRQVEVLEREVTSPGRKVMAGDLNSTPLWPAYRRLTRHLDDLVAEWARRSGRRAPRTWGHRPWWPAVLRIDHVLARGLAAGEVSVHRVRGGDHRALLVDLSLSRRDG